MSELACPEDMWTSSGKEMNTGHALFCDGPRRYTCDPSTLRLKTCGNPELNAVLPQHLTLSGFKLLCPYPILTPEEKLLGSRTWG